MVRKRPELVERELRFNIAVLLPFWLFTRPHDSIDWLSSSLPYFASCLLFSALFWDCSSYNDLIFFASSLSYLPTCSHNWDMWHIAFQSASEFLILIHLSESRYILESQTIPAESWHQRHRAKWVKRRLLLAHLFQLVILHAISCSL